MCSPIHRLTTFGRKGCDQGTGGTAAAVPGVLELWADRPDSNLYLTGWRLGAFRSNFALDPDQL